MPRPEMPRYHFDAVLTSEPTDEQADAVFEAFGGDPPSLATNAGTPYAMCHVDAGTLDEAFRVAMAGFRKAGLAVLRFEVEPEAVEA